jgi:YHS domain-containing protein
MAKDLVCGMVVDEKTARFKTTYKNETYYFCSAACLETFKKSPGKYVSK